MTQPTTAPAGAQPGAGQAPPAGGAGQPAAGAAPGGPDSGQQQPGGQPGDLNSPDALQERLRRRQQVIDQQADELRAWRALGADPTAVQARLAPAATDGQPAPVDEAALRAQIEADVRAAAGRDIAQAQLLAAATGRLQRPDDVLAFVDLGRIPIGPKGVLDAGHLDDAVAAVLEARPYLAPAAAGTPVQPGDGQRFTGGAGGGAQPPLAPKSLATRIAEAEAAGDYRASMALKAQQVFQTGRST